MEHISEETFTTKIPVVGRRTSDTTPRYDWDTILNGTHWLLTRGQDFHVKVPTIIQAARKEARERGILDRLIIAPDTTNRDQAIIIGPRPTPQGTDG